LNKKIEQKKKGAPSALKFRGFCGFWINLRIIVIYLLF